MDAQKPAGYLTSGFCGHWPNQEVFLSGEKRMKAGNYSEESGAECEAMQRRENEGGRLSKS
jgi:hypothetical protein